MDFYGDAGEGGDCEESVCSLIGERWGSLILGFIWSRLLPPGRYSILKVKVLRVCI